MMSIPPKLLNRLNIIPIKISARFFVATDKNTLKFIMKVQGIRIANTMSKNIMLEETVLSISGFIL